METLTNKTDKMPVASINALKGGQKRLLGLLFINFVELLKFYATMHYIMDIT